MRGRLMGSRLFYRRLADTFPAVIPQNPALAGGVGFRNIIAPREWEVTRTSWNATGRQAASVNGMVRRIDVVPAIETFRLQQALAAKAG